MADNWLKLNNEKTEFIIFGTRQLLKKHDVATRFSLTIADVTVVPSESAVRNLGVLFDRELSFKDHVAAVCQSSFYQLRRISTIKRYISESSIKTLVTSLVLSRTSRLLQFPTLRSWKATYSQATARAKLCCANDTGFDAVRLHLVYITRSALAENSRENWLQDNQSPSKSTTQCKTDLSEGICKHKKRKVADATSKIVRHSSLLQTIWNSNCNGME